MGYYSHFDGCIAIDPPITWGELAQITYEVVAIGMETFGR